MPSTLDPRNLLQRMFDAAVTAAQPAHCLPPHLPGAPKGRLIVLGAGKASAAMAKAVEDAWAGPLEGLVVTRYGYAAPCSRIEIVEAAHPVPDVAGRAAAERILEKACSAGPDDTVLFLISGGGSALLALPIDGISLEDKQAISRALLASGATISEINCVRRHLSAIKGGRLAAAAHPAKVVTLLISDVPGDRLCDIASGPTVPDETTCADALEIVHRYGLILPNNVRAVLEGVDGETVKPDDTRLAGIETTIIATPQASLEAAAAVVREAGLAVHILGDAIEGEARHVGTALAGIVRQIATRGQPFTAPCVLLSGGETTVTVLGGGRGGPNVEFLLALGVALDGLHNVWCLACDTDGADGMEDIAGAILTPTALERARAIGLRPEEVLAHNDAHAFFGAIGDAVVTGPTLTNVNDFRAIIIDIV